MTNLTAPVGFRLRTWEYPEGTPRVGMVCNRCGCCVDPPDVTAVTWIELEEAADRHECVRPVCEWDFWHRRAVATGVDPQLAELGRALIRENYQHGWNAPVDEVAMIRSAKRSPKSTARRWQAMLDADAGPALS